MMSVQITCKEIPSKAFRNLLLVCFFSSGACGLIYEVAWLRSMGLIFGNTTFATSAVLASYMAGLGLGALWWGKRIDRHSQPVKVYAWLEAGIGIYALLTPILWTLIDLVTIGFYRFITPAFLPALIFKLAVSFAALLFPTFLMGATLPVLSKYFIQGEKEVAKQVGLLYGLNTFGAVIGVLISGFFALEVLGVRETVYLTAVINFVIFFLCSRFRGPARRAAPLVEQEPRRPITAPAALAPTVVRLLLISFAVSGAVSMMYKVAWTRVLATALGSSVYAFSIMLATFLLGISIGSYFFSLIANRLKIDLSVFSFFQLVTALTALLGINYFNDMPYYFLRIYTHALGSELILNLGKFALCSAVMLLPTVAIGAMFSCFIHVIRQSKPIERELGEAYFANTIGTIAGSVLTGFIIIPWIGIQNTLILAASLNVAIGIFTLVMGRPPFDWKSMLGWASLLALIVATAFSVRPWDRGFISSGLALRPNWAIGKTKSEILTALGDREMLFYKDGFGSTVTVRRLEDSLLLAVNGKTDASSNPQDNVTQALLGYVPMTLHPTAQKVMIIGLGSGSTAAAVAAYPVRQIDVVEIEKAVEEGADYFKDFNRHVLADPRVKVHINDGRNFALLTPEKYDVIISEPSNPWMAGVANLFSIEHYRSVKKKLAKEGVVCQWLQTYSMSSDDLRMVIKTFSSVFPETSIWTTQRGDLLLIGKNEPLVLDIQSISKSFEIPQVKKDFNLYEIRSAEGFLSNALLFSKDIPLLTKNSRINSDNHPYLEFSAPRNLYRETIEPNVTLLMRYWSLSALPEIKNLEPPRNKNVTFYNALARGYIYKKYYPLANAALIKAIQIEPANPETLLLIGIFDYFTSDLQKAQKLLSAAIAIEPDNAEAYYYSGLIFRDAGQAQDALTSFAKAVKSEPQNTLYLTALANALFTAEQYETALKFFNRALEIEPHNIANWKKKTVLILKLGSFEEKKKICQEVMRRYPMFSANYQLYGDLLALHEQFSEARSVFLKLLALDPRSAKAYLNLAEISRKLGDKKMAKHYLRMAIRCDATIANNSEAQKQIWS